MAKLIDGKEISKNIKDELKEKVATLKKEGKECTLAGREGMHPCDNTCAIIIIICLIEGLSDKLTGNQCRLPYYLIGKNARFVKLSYNDLGMLSYMT